MICYERFQLDASLLYCPAYASARAVRRQAADGERCVNGVPRYEKDDIDFAITIVAANMPISPLR